MTEALLKAITVEPPEQADSCVIWLHGLGADGYDFVDAIPSLKLPPKHRIRFIFPHAPAQPVTINNGIVMPAWYDIKAIDLDTEQDEIGLKKSENSVQSLIAQMIEQGISSDRIILIGFSQGGALALYTALRFSQSLGGVAALSAYLPLHHHFISEYKSFNQPISVFMAHGLMDPVVPYWIGEKSFRYLEQMGHDVKWYAYPMPHTVCLQELSDLGTWCVSRLS